MMENHDPGAGFKHNREKVIELVGWRTYYLIRHAKTRRKKYKKKLEEIDKEIEFLKPKFKEFNVTIGEQKINVQCIIEGGHVETANERKIKDDEYDEWLKRLGC